LVEDYRGGAEIAEIAEGRGARGVEGYLKQVCSRAWIF
jgi:hypothetical protein